MDRERHPHMPLYEHVFLARQDVSAQQVEELTAQFTGVIEQLGGKVTKLEQWGVKTLFLPVSQKNPQGFIDIHERRRAARSA